MQRHFAEKRDAKPRSFMPGPAMAEYVGAGAAAWAEEVTHVLHHAQHGHIDPFEHGNTAPRIDQSEILRSRNNYCAFQGYLLRHCELGVASSRRHVDDHDIQLAPFDLAQHLGDRRHDHWPAPDHWRFFIDQKSNRHHAEAVAIDRLETGSTDGLRFFPDGEQLWQGWPVDVGIEHADLQT